MPVAVLLLILFTLAAWYIPPYLLKLRVIDTYRGQRDIAFALEDFRAFYGRPPTPDEYYDASMLRPNGTRTSVAVAQTLTSPVFLLGASDTERTLPHDEHALPGDLFRAPRGEWHLAYWTDGTFWLVRSVGPDGIEGPALLKLGAMVQSSTDYAVFLRSMNAVLYDMSNGLRSAGDIVMTGP